MELFTLLLMPPPILVVGSYLQPWPYILRRFRIFDEEYAPQAEVKHGNWLPENLEIYLWDLSIRLKA